MYSVTIGKSIIELAKVLHEAGREAVEKNCIVRRDVPTKGFIEWEDMDEQAREGRMIQARFLLDRYVLLPMDNTRACSGCRTLTNALNDMDESRRLFIQHREALVALVGASEPEELGKMRVIIEALAPDDEKEKVLTAIDTLLIPFTATPAVAGGAL